MIYRLILGAKYRNLLQVGRVVYIFFNELEVNESVNILKLASCDHEADHTLFL